MVDISTAYENKNLEKAFSNCLIWVLNNFYYRHNKHPHLVRATFSSSGSRRVWELWIFLFDGNRLKSDEIDYLVNVSIDWFVISITEVSMPLKVFRGYLVIKYLIRSLLEILDFFHRENCSKSTIETLE